MRLSLPKKILLLALLNALLLAAVILIFARSQFKLGTESLLIGPAKDRIQAIGTAFAVDFDATPEPARVDLLAQYRQRYDAEFFILTPRGQPLAGLAVELPPEVRERMRRGGPPRRRPPLMGGDGPPGEGPPGGGPPDGRPDDGPPGGPPGPPVGPPREPVFLVIAGNPVRYWVGVRFPVSSPSGDRLVPALLLMRANSMFNSALFFDWRLWLVLALSVTGVSVLCWLPFIRGLTRSITQMDRVAAQVAQGRFEARAPEGRGDELGHLGREINRMSARLERFVKNQKRFLGDIAHELCGPIARIQFALGILEQRAEEVQQPHVGVLRDEIQEMSGLVNELLSFSKASMETGATPLEAVAVRDAIERAVAREATRGAEIKIVADPRLTAMAHEGYLVRAIANLLRNAIRYASEQGPITVSAEREGSEVRIVVTDSGPGLPEDALEQVFEPFYRPERERRRETGGAGLGLAIVKSCVEACRGTVSARNREPAGLQVTIRLGAGS